VTVEEVEQAIREVLAAQLDLEPQIIATRFSSGPLLGAASGLDSVDALNLITALENRFNFEVKDEDLEVNLFASIRTLAQYVVTKTSPESQPETQAAANVAPAIATIPSPPAATARGAQDFYLAFVVSLLEVSRRLPLPLRRSLIRSTAAAAYRLSSMRGTIVRSIDRALGPDLSAAPKKALARGVFYHFWWKTFWAAPSTEELELIAKSPIAGEEHLRAAIGRNLGVILLEADLLGDRNLARRALHARGYAVHPVYGINHDASGFQLDPECSSWGVRRLREYFQTAERQYLAEEIHLPSGGSIAFTRDLIEGLKRNYILGLAGGGRISQHLVTLPFFGARREFSTGIFNLARTSGATILPIFGLHRGYAHLEIVVEPPIDVRADVIRDGNVDAGLRAYVELLEGYCRRNPEQFNSWSDL